ncbi:choice-of-anchor R domain-containing protein [Candidatus Poriferisodalis sp.]|uniref:choice-of-anchor R domain-containing protein n=1 Tax=Candidatus Poriferisodalis sp. TaxID=3101277 RepID=UPI003B0255BE
MGALLALVPLSSAGAQTPTPSVLVSNVGQSTGGGSLNFGTSDAAQAFSTGSNASGYTLSSVDVRFGGLSQTDAASRLRVTVNADAGGFPGAVVGTLTFPVYTAFSSDQTLRFKAPEGGISLAADTTYFVVLDSFQFGWSGFASLWRTTSDGEDAGAAAGWSIADTSLSRFWSNAVGGWSSESRSVTIGVNGVPVEPPALPQPFGVSLGRLFEGERRSVVVWGLSDGSVEVRALQAVSGVSASAGSDFRVFYPSGGSVRVDSGPFDAAVVGGVARFDLEGVADSNTEVGAQAEFLRLGFFRSGRLVGDATVELVDASVGGRSDSVLFRVCPGADCSPDSDAGWVESYRPRVVLREGGGRVVYQYKLIGHGRRYVDASVDVWVNGSAPAGYYAGSIRSGLDDHDRLRCHPTADHRTRHTVGARGFWMEGYQTPTGSEYPNGNGVLEWRAAPWYDLMGGCGYYRNAVSWAERDDWHTVEFSAGHDSDAFDESFRLSHVVTANADPVIRGQGPLKSLSAAQLRALAFVPYETGHVQVHIVDDDVWEQELEFSGDGGATWVAGRDGGLEQALPATLGAGSSHEVQIRLRYPDAARGTASDYVNVRVAGCDMSQSERTGETVVIGGVIRHITEFVPQKVTITPNFRGADREGCRTTFDWGTGLLASAPPSGTVTLTVHAAADAAGTVSALQLYNYLFYDRTDTDLPDAGATRDIVSQIYDQTRRFRIVPAGPGEEPDTDDTDDVPGSDDAPGTDDAPGAVDSASEPVRYVMPAALVAEVEAHIASFRARSHAAGVRDWTAVLDRLQGNSGGMSDDDIAAWLARSRRHGWADGVATLPKVQAALTAQAAAQQQQQQQQQEPVGDSDDQPLRLPVVVPEVTVTSAAAATEGAAVTFAVAASPAPTADLAVAVAVTAAGDYGVTTGTRTVTIPAGTMSATLSVPTVDDTADEPDGTVTATVTAGDGYTIGAASTRTAAVTDDDEPPPPAVSVSAAAGVSEGGVALFTVSADVAPAADLPVSVTVAASGDYGVATGTRTVTIAAGTTSKVLSVATADDSVDEADGSVSVTVADGADYDVGTATATVSVTDDDDPPPVQDVPDTDDIEDTDQVPADSDACTAKPTVAAADATATRGDDLEFVISIDCAHSSHVEVTYTIAHGGAYADGGTVRISSGDTTATVRVPTIGASDVGLYLAWVTEVTNPYGTWAYGTITD